MSETKSALIPEQFPLVNESDYLRLSRLVLEHAWRIIRHVCGNMRFVTTGENTAEGTTVLTVFMVAGPAAATTQPFSVGEDHDQFVRTIQGWRLVSRRWVELFARGDALSLP